MYENLWDLETGFLIFNIYVNLGEINWDMYRGKFEVSDDLYVKCFQVG